MSNLIVKGTELTPTIEFDSSTGNLLIKGTSIPENPFESFDPLLKVLDSYNAQPSSKTKVDFIQKAGLTTILVLTIFILIPNIYHLKRK